MSTARFTMITCVLSAAVGATMEPQFIPSENGVPSRLSYFTLQPPLLYP